ncbi:MAG: hypothetical protein GC189_02415 [Alphaproteobacteria bacterium]|nr:hypothetical protein [Alphaproteobacteria bacterium]
MKVNSRSSKRFARLLLLATAFILWGAREEADAETLEEAEAIVLAESPSLAAAREQLEAVRELSPLAWSEALPQISFDAQMLDIDRSEQRLAFDIRDQPEYWIASVNTSTLLFGSGRVWTATRQARAQVASGIATYQDQAQVVLLDLARAYGQTRFARQVVEAQEDLIDNLRDQVAFASANQREGFLTRTDVAQAESRLALARADRTRARLALVEASQTYQRIVGFPPGDLPEPAPLENLPATLDEAIDVAQSEHPAIRAAIANVVFSEASVDNAASEGRLRITLETGNSRFDVVGPSDFTEQHENSVGVRVTVPFFSGGSVRARTRQQRHLRNASRFELAETQRRVHERVTVSWFTLSEARQRQNESIARLEAAQRASAGFQREQQLGERSMIDVLNQEQELINARIATHEADRDAMVAERALLSSIGKLGPRLNGREGRDNGILARIGRW